MPICPTCGKNITLSWQMEKHQKSSRCKLYAKTKELERVSSDLHIMCGNVEKLQSALIALEKEPRLSSPDTETRNSMEKIMNKLQEIWDLVKHETRELHSSESQPPANVLSVSSVSAIRSTDNSPVLESSRATQTSVPENQPVSPLSPADRVSLMRSELKEYLKQARPSVVKLAESHQVPHLIELFSNLASAEMDDSAPIGSFLSPQIIPQYKQEQSLHTLQQISDSNSENTIQNAETTIPKESITYQTINTSSNLDNVLTKKEIQTEYQTTISEPKHVELSAIHLTEQNSALDSEIKQHVGRIIYPSLSVTTSQREELPNKSSESISVNMEKFGNSRDIETQTIIITRRRKPHSAKVLGNYHLH